MCHLSMKLSDKFDPNQHISVKATLLKLGLEPKGPVGTTRMYKGH